MVGPTKETSSYGIPIFQTVNETAQGGFTLDDSGVADGTIIKAGTVVSYDETTRKAKVAKVAVLQAAATNTATEYRVLKGHNLKVGDSIEVEDGGTARTISSIVTTDEDYDAVNVATTIGTAADAGDALLVDDTGYSDPKGLLYWDVEKGTNTDLSVVIDGTVYENRIPSVPKAVKAKLPKIFFSKSF